MKKILACVLAFSLLLCTGCTSLVLSGKPTEKQFSRGVISENTYENAFLGLGVELDENWVFYSDEEIAALYGIVEDSLYEDFGDYIENATIIYDMHVANTADASNMNINFEKVENLGSTDMSAYVSSVMPTVANSLETIGCTDVVYEICDVVIDGETFAGARVSATISGLQLYQTLICVGCGDYIANISIATYLTDNTQSIIDCFYIVK